MTVKELIEVLQRMPQEAKVFYDPKGFKGHLDVNNYDINEYGNIVLRE